MNKKKSKALAFLLATSLLVPSANGIVSAAELNVSSNMPYVEDVTESKIMVGNEKFDNLSDAVKKAKETNEVVKISGTVNLESGINIDGVTIRGENNARIVGTNLFSASAEGTTAKLENIEFVNNSKGGYFIYQDNASLEVRGCRFIPATDENYVVNLIMIEGQADKKKFIFEGNTVEINCRVCIPGIPDNSSIKNNTIDLLNEKYQGDKSQRASMLSLTATEKSNDIEISGNTFKNANRAIAVDKSNMFGENLIIKNNKFMNTRFAFEVGSKEAKNKGKIYDLSNNYYFNETFGGVGPLRIEDATPSEGASHFEDGISTKLEIKDSTPLNIIVGPYYTKEDRSGIAHTGVATVNGKDYARLDKAIKSAKLGDTVKLTSNIEVDDWNQIWNIKGITLDGNKKIIKIKNNIKSLENHDAVLHSLGGNTFKDITINLETVNPGKAQGIRAISAGNGDTIENVNIIGGKNVSYGITAGTDCKSLIIKKSNISNCGSGVYFDYGKYDDNTEILIENNKFDSCEYASILYPTGVTFKGNTVEGGKVNIMNDSTVVRENTFKYDETVASRVKFYTEGNDKTFKYNKVENKSDDNVGVTIEFATGDDKIDYTKVDISKNFWGTSNPNPKKIIPKVSEKEATNIFGRDFFKSKEELDNYLDPKPVIPSVPSKPSKPTYKHEEIIGSDRYDTAAKIADQLGSYDNVVLVNATSSMSDGLSASGLAGKENGAILLTKKDSIPKATMDRIKKVKKVYIIGGEAAISEKVADEIKAAGIKVERIGGKDRVETSELVAKKLGNYTNAFVVNGFKGEADAMSASAVAAKNGSPILLTNGKKSNHDKKSGVEYYVIGGNSVVDKSIAKKYNAEVLAGDDRYETNREVIEEFYSNSEKLYFANGETLVDALTASTISKKDGLVLVGKKSDNSVLNKKNTVQVGGMNFDVELEK